MLILAAPLLLGACMGWHESITPMPAQVHALRSPVRVTRRDRFQVVLDSAVVRGDSIVGFRQGAVEQHVAIALQDVAQVEQRQVDPGRTLMAGAGGVLAAMGVYMLLVLEGLRSGSS